MSCNSCAQAADGILLVAPSSSCSTKVTAAATVCENAHIYVQRVFMVPETPHPDDYRCPPMRQRGVGGGGVGCRLPEPPRNSTETDIATVTLAHRCLRAMML